jgi:hypothetical protein
MTIKNQHVTFIAGVQVSPLNRVISVKKLDTDKMRFSHVLGETRARSEILFYSCRCHGISTQFTQQYSHCTSL